MFKVKSLDHFFKPEVRKRGEDYYDKDAVYLSQATDTAIAGVIKGTPPIRIKLSSESISNSVFTTACSCSASQKGKLCKHIWGTILTAALDYPDFFAAKTDLVKAEFSNPATKFNQKLKAKQSANRKEQYQKVKSEKKARNKKAKALEQRPTYSKDIEEALKFFSENGFEFEYPVKLEALSSAKKLLSRVFHPDKGGTHDEALILNKHFDALSAVARN